MKSLILFLLTTLTFNFATAGFVSPYDAAELTDEALIAQVEAIADELEANVHDQEIMNMVFNRSRVVLKTLDTAAAKVNRLDDAGDGDILPLLQDIVISLDILNHTDRTLTKVKRHLDKILTKLEDNRQAPTEIAVLSFSGAALFDFGTVVSGAIRTINIAVTNDGNGAANILGESGLADPFYFAGKVGYPGVGGTCGAIIVADETCFIAVEYNPTTTASTFSGEVLIDYNDGLEVQSISKSLQGSTF